MSRQPISQESLFAYVDNELDPASTAKIEAAMADDPELASLIEEQRALRALLGSAYSPVLQEAIPSRLLQAAGASAPAKKRPTVVKLAAARAQRDAAKAERAARPAATGAWTWKHWGGMAACLAVGVLAGQSTGLMHAFDDVAEQGGQIVARGQLAQALSTQLASAQTADSPVKIGLSFLSKSGEYCRSFTVKQAGTDGLACRHGDAWALRVVEQNKPGPSADAKLSMAASTVPAAVLKVVDDQIQGGALDANAERAAMGRGWRAP